MSGVDPANLYVPYTNFEFYDYYHNAQGELVYLKGANKPIKPIEPKEVDMSTFEPDPRDPGNAPFIFPPGVTREAALAAQQGLTTQVSGNVSAAVLELAKTALKAEIIDPTQILKATSTVDPNTAIVPVSAANGVTAPIAVLPISATLPPVLAPVVGGPLIATPPPVVGVSLLTPAAPAPTASVTTEAFRGRNPLMQTTNMSKPSTWATWKIIALLAGLTFVWIQSSKLRR